MNSERQNPAFYALLVVLIFMSVGPIYLMLVNSFKLDVDIIGGTSGLLFLPTIQNYETALCDILWYEPEHLDFCSLKFGGAFYKFDNHRPDFYRINIDYRVHGSLRPGSFSFFWTRYGLTYNTYGKNGSTRCIACSSIWTLE